MAESEIPYAMTKETQSERNRNGSARIREADNVG
jgi:hypothetical protein